MRIILILLLCASQNLFAQNLNFGLKAYYPFNGNALDQSGYDNNPIFNNATLTADKFGNANSAYHFNGIDNYIRIPNASSLNTVNQISLCAKVKATGFYTNLCYNNIMMVKGDDDYLTGVYFLRFSDQVTGCTNNPSTTTEQFYGQNTVAPDPYVQLNTWYDIVWTYDGSVGKIYVNCVLKATVSTSLSFTNSYDLFFGKLNNPQYPFFLNGDLDEVRIYDRVITQAEVNLYGGCSVLPVTFRNFAASVINNDAIKLVWNTSEETNIKSYSIERLGGNTAGYTNIGTMNANRNSVENNYSFTDTKALPNITYSYRIVSNDLAGNKKYSDIKNARIVKEQFYALTYPNPTTGKISLTINNYSGVANVKISNTLGQVILQKKINAIASVPVLLNISDAPQGTYWISIQTEKDHSIEKIIKQ